jgi:ketosteroid isomerase-like protein
MAFEGPLEDRLLIRERMGAYADAVFQRDCEAWLANWTEDCVWQTLGQELRGKAALRGAWQQIWAPLDRMTFFTEVGAIEVEGDRAAARCYCREILFFKDGGLRKVVGGYEDELARQDGTWLFARRKYRLLMAEAPRAGET